MTPMELQGTLANKIDDLAERGNVLLDSHRDWRGAIAAWEEALDLLPEPKSQWEAWTWLNASIGDAARSGGDLNQARTALFDAVSGPDGQSNPFVLLRLGQTLVDLGDADRGVDYLLRAYMIDGENVFKSDGTFYLNLLRQRGLID
jgi:tetratricopeptide (TPR) repeat protein